MYTLIKNCRIVLFLLVGLSVSALNHADDSYIGRFESLNYETKTIQVSDSTYSFTGFTVVRKYGNEEQKLPLSALNKGDWVSLEYEYNSKNSSFIARTIRVLPSEKIANKLMQAKVDD